MKMFSNEKQHLAMDLAAEESAVTLKRGQRSYTVVVNNGYGPTEETRWTWAKIPTSVEAQESELRYEWQMGDNGQMSYLPALVQDEDIREAMDGSPVDVAVRLLRWAGIEVRVPMSPALGVLIAEAVNLAAKELEYGFYQLKPLVCDEVAAWPGVQSGWGEDGAFYLAADGAGTCSFHDPNGEITAGGKWPHPWSGVRRQAMAFECLADAPVRRQLAVITSPKLAAHLARHQPNLCGPIGQLP